MKVVVAFCPSIETLLCNSKYHTFIVSCGYLQSKSSYSHLSIEACVFHKLLVVAFANTSIKIDCTTKQFHVEDKFGYTMKF
jgi:hypothetical protein